MTMERLDSHLLLLPQDGLLRTDHRALARDVQRGRRVKLRRGAYVDGELWQSSSARARHLLRIRAVLAVAERPAIVAGASAAAVHGVPIAGEWPEEVTLLDEWRGGGRSEPGVRRTAAGFGTARRIDVNGFPVTTLSRTVLDVARGVRFQDAVGSVDWALWRDNPVAISKHELGEELERTGFRAGRRKLEAVVRFATHLSDSFGESACRAVMWELGFEAPELQLVFRDAEGRMEPDFTWRSAKVFGEFDGKAKYIRDEYTGGDPGEVVWREKKREDRLRRMGLSGIRILTADVRTPARLNALLSAAGVPRRLPTRAGPGLG